MGKIADFLYNLAKRRLVGQLLLQEAYLTPGFSENALRASDGARERIMAFPEEERLTTLLVGLDGERTHVRVACAELLLHWKHPSIGAAMARHLDDPDERVRSRAKLYREL